MWTEVEELAVLLRNGDVKWEDLDLDDVDVRMKWAGLFHRSKRTPGKFMQRLKVSQGVLSSEQLRALVPDMLVKSLEEIDVKSLTGLVGK